MAPFGEGRGIVVIPKSAHYDKMAENYGLRRGGKNGKRIIKGKRKTGKSKIKFV